MSNVDSRRILAQPCEEDRERCVNIDFCDILALLCEEDYERCEKAADGYLRGAGATARYAPYARYMKSFAHAYRAWEISYHYTTVRSHFQVAHDLLIRELNQHFPHGWPADDQVLEKALGILSSKLCTSTWCENSYINNDPEALARHAAQAVKWEDEALRLLQCHPMNDPALARLADCLVKYFEKGRLLHDGLNACALIYQTILKQHGCPEALYREQIERAEKDLAELAPLSPELHLSLNSHVAHARRHYERLEWTYPTILRVPKGKLVLSLAAACDRKVVSGIMKNLDGFGKDLSAHYSRLGIESSQLRRDQTHDIFETSFGQEFVQSLSFNLPSIQLRFDGGHEYELDTKVNLSTLGVCTLSFTLAIDKQDGGISVEEIRALQSCICPHAGQVKISLKGDDLDHHPRCLPPRLLASLMLDRMDLSELKRVFRVIEQWLKGPSLPQRAKLPKKILHTLAKALRDKVFKVRECETLEGIGAKTDAPGFINLLESLADGLNKLTHDPTLPESARSEACQLIQRLTDRCDVYTYLAQLARLLLYPIEEALKDLGKKRARDRGRILWHFAPDTGWYTSLYAMAIDEAAADGTVRRRRVGFDEIIEHSDTPGLIIEQREARASFDDWRFMKFDVREQANLAGIRSHDTDAFFISEYQAFLYFPNDPQFITDQYEATVEIMNRLNVSMRFHNHLCQDLSGRMLASLEKKESRSRNLLDEVWRHRAAANEIQNLMSKADLSRYKDHGDLMTQIIQKMKLDKVCQQLDRYLKNLEDTYGRLVAQAEIKRFRFMKGVTALLSCFLATTAVNSFVDAMFRIERVRGFYTDLFPSLTANEASGWTTVIVSAFLTVVIGVTILMRGKSDT